MSSGSPASWSSSRASWSTSGPPPGRRASIEFEISYDRFIRTDRRGPCPSLDGDGAARAGGRRHLQGHLRGLVLPGRQRVQDRFAARRRPLPRPPGPRAELARGGELLLPRCRATRSALEQLYRDNPSFCEPEHFRNEVLGWLREGLQRFLDQPCRDELGDPVPRRSRASDLRLVRRPHELPDRRRIPR